MEKLRCRKWVFSSDRRRACNESGPPTLLIDFSRNPSRVYQPLHNRLLVSPILCVTHTCAPVFVGQFNNLLRYNEITSILNNEVINQ